MRVVNPSGGMVGGGFDVGCSHSSFERMLWDGTKYITVCNNDAPTGGKTGRIAFAPATTTIYPVDELNTDLGAVVKAGGGGYWIAVSDLRPGQTAGVATASTTSTSFTRRRALPTKTSPGPATRGSMTGRRTWRRLA